MAGATSLSAFPEAALVVIEEEIRQRRAHGLDVASEEIWRRYPQWAARLLPHAAVPPPVPSRAGRLAFPAVGEVLGDFQLIRELGRGTRGRVYLAVQRFLADRPVVLKMTPREGQEHLRWPASFTPTSFRFSSCRSFPSATCACCACRTWAGRP